MIISRVVYGDVTVLNILIAILLLMGGLIVSKLLAFNLRRSFREKLNRERLELIVKVFSYTVILIATLLVLPQLGVEPSGLMVAGGIVGIALGFASQGIVGNLISGLFLIFERPIKIGDNVSIGQVQGFVEDIRVISTTIRTFEGLYVRIPNEKVFSENIINYVAHLVRRVDYVVSIRYADNAEKAIEIILRVLQTHPLVLVNPAPYAYVDELGDDGVNIIVRAWTPTMEWFGVKTEMLWKIKHALEEEGIEIPFPQRTLWFAEKLTHGREQGDSQQ